MEIAKQIGGFTPAEADDLRKAIGKKKRDLMATMEDKFIDGCAASGTSAGGRQGPLVADDGGGRLLVQPVPRRLLRADRLPDRLAEGELPGRVHGGADLVGDVDQGQGPVLRQPLRRDGDRGAAARRQRLRPRLRRLRQDDPLRPRRGQERRPRGGRRRSSRAREADGEFESIWDFCERVDARAVNKRAIECLVKCGALDSTGATRQGMLEVLPQAQSARPEGAGGRAARPGLDLRPRRRRRRRTRPAAALAPPRHRSSPTRSSSSASCSRWRRRRSAPSSPRTRWPRCATRCARGSTARSPSSARKPDGSLVTVGGIVAEAKKVRTRSGRRRDVRDARRPRGPGRAARPRRRRRGGRRRSRSTASSLVRGRLDHKERGQTKLVVQEAERFEPDEDELAARAGEGGSVDGAGLDRAADRRRASSAPRLVDELKALFETLPGRDRGDARDARPARAIRRLRFGDELPGRPVRGAARRARRAARARRPWPRDHRLAER